MCGIHGFNFRDEKLINEMIAAAFHRGPDGSGRFMTDKLSLGHNLLYITEKPEHSGQPWIIDDGRYVLVFNGEIYNYRELRKVLKGTGMTFKTDCDTEVLATGLAKFGETFIKKLDGMFAFAWYDKQKQTVLLARDPGGMKPLYYYNKGGRFVFSSELTSLLLHGMERKFDLDSLSIYLQLGYIPGPRTLLQNIFKLSPGEVMELKIENGEVVNKYTNCDTIPQANTNFDVATYQQKFTTAVQHSMIGIRKFGLYLSAGLDSSAILHEACEMGIRPQTLSTYFETPKSAIFNEDAILAKKLARHYGTKHITLIVTEKDFIDAIEPTYQALEEPRYNRSSPVYYLAAQAMAKAGVTITLSGDGGDEMLTGYPHHTRMAHASSKATNWEHFRHFVKQNYIRFLDNPDKVVDRWCDILRFKNILPELENSYNLNTYMKDWLKLRKISKDVVNNHLFMEQLGWLPEDALIRNDKLGMHFSMEGRFPFLSRQYRKYAMSIPHQQKLSSTKSKLMARQALAGKLPDYILNKPKSGWASPVLMWEKTGNLSSRIQEILSRDYYAPLYDIPFFASTAQQANVKTKYACLYLQVWARQFKVGI